MSLTVEKFKFVSAALDSDVFTVVRFHGQEEMSKLFEFEITLLSKNMDVDLDQVMEKQAVFSILRPDENVPIHGVLKHFDVLHAIDDNVFYRAVLVPSLWWLTLTESNQIFLDKSVPEILTAVLKDGGLTESDFEFRLQNSYAPQEYVCQYRESHYNFLSRWMEHEGLYSFFEHGPSKSKLIITDTKLSHREAGVPKLIYLPPTGLETTFREDVLSSFTCRRTTVPKSFQVKDYNYQKPDIEVAGETELSHQSPGKVYLYGEHVATPAEGQAKAKIRSEEYRSRHELYHGSGTTSFLQSGYCFVLENHFRSGFNRKYLVTATRHQGSQAAFLTAGLRKSLNELETELHYNMEFTAIPAEVQFRPERITEKPRFHGAISAKIDAAGSTEYAELDEHGRYKVILPFDLSGRSGGKASKPLRLMQPYTGADHGIHFPLHKDTEVLVTFIDGDPDRPVIAGAVPNPSNPSVVKNKNQTQAIIQTGGQSQITFEDKKGAQCLAIKTPVENTYMRMGSHPEPDDGHEENGFYWSTEGHYISEIGTNFSCNILGNKMEVTAGTIEEITAGAFTEIVAGAFTDIVAGQFMEIILGMIVEYKKGWSFEIGESKRIGISPEAEVIGAEKVEIKAGGEMPGVNKAIVQAISLVSTITSGVIAASKTKKGTMVPKIATAASIAGISSLIWTILTVYLAKTKMPHAFKSSLTLDNHETSLEAPKVSIEAASTDVVLKAAKDFQAAADKKVTVVASDDLILQSRQKTAKLTANKAVTVQSETNNLVLQAQKAAILKSEEKAVVTSDQVQISGTSGITLKTNNFKWVPGAGGRMKAGPLNIDAGSGQVKIG